MKKLLPLKVILLLALAQKSYAQNIPNSLFTKPNQPVVTVGGFINFNAAGRSQEDAYDSSRLPDARIENQLVDPDNQGTHNQFSRANSFANDSEIYIKVGAISDSGLKYGAIVELEADTTTDGLEEGVNADKSFIFTETSIGKFEFGNNNGVNQKMKVGPSVFARATGGINGKYLQHINMPVLSHSTQLSDQNNIVCQGGVGVQANGNLEGNTASNTNCNNVKLPRFILIPQSPVAHGGYSRSFYSRATDNNYQIDQNGSVINDASTFNGNNRQNPLFGYKNGSFGQMEDATKISFYTPRVSGFQIGASFTPDTGDNGTTSALSGEDSGDIENVISWGVNYSNNFGNLGVAFSATGEHGAFETSEVNTNQINRNNLDSYDAGVMLTYFGFTIGGSFGFWGDSLQPTSGIYSCNYDETADLASQTCDPNDQEINSFDDSQYFTAGIAYEFGPFAASVTHISSEFQANEYSATSFGVDYKWAKGLMPYFEITQFEFSSNQPSASNISDQDVLGDDERQLQDNKGFVGLVGILLSF